MSGPLGSSQWMYATGAAVEGQSLRFNDNDSAYLSWTPASAGNRKTWTWSAWVKRGNISSYQTLFWAGTDANNRTHFGFDNADKLRFYHAVSGSYEGVETSAVYRDVSSWYHIVFVLDTTLASSELDRAKIYVNGVLQATSQTFGGTITQNEELDVNSTQLHSIGDDRASSIPFDGYLSEVNFVDGLALDPTSFAETDANGQWVPIKEPSVTYGTNGFYLPFTNDYEVEGFNTVTYTGTGADQYIGGVGFEPDLVWLKNRGAAQNHALFDSVRGANKRLQSNSTDAEATRTSALNSFDTDGFTVGSEASTGQASNTYVAWAWDMGTGSAASNTDGSITSSVKANPTYGQSIVSYTGTGSAATVGHGLSSAPDLIIVKNRDTARNWTVYNSASGATKYLLLNTTNADQTATSIWNDTAPTSSVFSVGTSQNINYTENYIAYCFHSVDGYSDFGSYTGNGSTSGPTVTTGFAPAFVMVKSASGVTGGWRMWDATRNPVNPIDHTLHANDSTVEDNYGNDEIDFLSDGFQIKNTGSYDNTSGATYIYMAFADKREAAFWLDQSGNNNDWTNNNMQESDISLDSPTNNFATLNSVVKDYQGTLSYSQGNLRTSASVNSGFAESTISITSGKYYVEMLYESGGGTLSGEGLGFTYTGGGLNSFSSGYVYRTNGTIYIDGTNSASVSTYDVGDIVAMSIDADSGEINFYKNGSVIYTVTGLSYQKYTPYVWNRAASGATSLVANFGQDSSFAGNKVAQGYTDENGFGDFYYEPPAGYLALCTQNLPDPAIADGTEHFNTVLYTGNGSTQSITGVGFQPDWTWVKRRDSSASHNLHDVVRGANQQLNTDGTAAESSNSNFSSFDSDGFTVISGGGYNGSTNTYVAWNWKADNTSGASNTDGSITSTVSANPTAGFSIVSWEGTSDLQTIGHGLSQAPEMVIVKNRDTSGTLWYVYHEDVGNTSILQLQSTAAPASSSNYWNNTSPTSSVVTMNSSVNRANSNIAYCFHSVEGYSKFGSYTGNGSTDGPFVYTGFRPAFVMWKNASITGNWQIIDSSRNTYNVSNTLLNPNSSVAEATSGGNIADFTSNGFKARGTGSVVNGSGNTIIYMAFAENPFKYSNAR